MKNYEEITAALLRRREEYERKKKRQRLLLSRAGVMAASCALVAVLALQPLAMPGGDVPLVPMPNYGEEGGKTNNKGPGQSLQDPVDPNRPVNGNPDHDDPDNNQGGNVDHDRPQIIDPDDDFAVGQWQGKQVTGQLLEWLQNADAADMLPLVWAKPGIDMSYHYKGETLQQYWNAAEAERKWPERMASLYKMGDSLKYGEALYTTGTPDGEKWEEELYREVVTYIGQELLDRFIVEGVFLKEKLWETMKDSEYLYAAQARWTDALEAYREYACSAAKGVLLQQGLEAYHPGNYVGIAKITKAQFEAIDAEYFDGWTFGMGEDPNAPQDMTDTDDVIAGNCTHTEDCDCSGEAGVNKGELTPDSSKQPGSSANNTNIGVGFDDKVRGDQPA